MGSITLNVPVSDSPVPAALDAFYGFIKDIAPPGPGDKIAIFGTIVEFDITKNSSLYNDFVVRAFADRSVRVSPVSGQAPGDISDRYSSRFTDMLSALVLSLDAELTPAQQAQIQRHEAAIDAISNDRDKYLDDIENAWLNEMQKLGIDPKKIDTDPDTRQRYYDERVKFLATRRYAQRVWGLDGFNTKIRHEEIAVGALRNQAFPDDDYAQLYHLYESCVDDLVIRPRQPELEITHHWDAVTIQDPTNFALSAVLDIHVETSSIVDPRTVLNGGGQRGYSVDIHSRVTNEHDHDWNVSGSGSYMPFISGNFSSSNSDHFRSTIDHVRQIEVQFDHLAELQVYRDHWFASTALTDNARVRDFLRKNPKLREKLNLLSTGLIVGRGLKLTLTFNDSSDVQEWGSSSTSGGGGCNILGVQLGGQGGSSSSYNNHQIDTNNRTVTFKDDPTVCRLIGLRTSPQLLSTGSLRQLAGARPLWEIPALREAAQALLVAGRIPNLSHIFDDTSTSS
jgi:hypothetical protein